MHSFSEKFTFIFVITQSNADKFLQYLVILQPRKFANKCRIPFL